MRSGDLRLRNRANDARRGLLRSITRSPDHTITRLFLAAVLSLGAASAPRSEPLSFPRDHGSHPAANIEWWYYTGHLTGEAGRPYGFLLVFFRLRQFHLAHFAWTDVPGKTFRFDEKAHLGLPGIAGAREESLDVVNEDWSAKEQDGVHRLRASADGAELELALTSEKPPVLHGTSGIVRKGAGENEFSRYVSITRLAARGTRKAKGRAETLAGTAWFDHEWGPGALPAEAAGWDWFSLQLSDGSELMLYRMRRKDGSATPSSSGTFVPASGPTRHVAWADVRLESTGSWRSPRSGADYPAGWRLAVASIGLEASISPVLADQELVTGKSTGVTYWEGACRVDGARAGRPIRGQAYAELTGYASRDVPGFAAGSSPGGAYFGAGAFVGLGGFSLVSSETMKLAALSRFR
jgi:predicted secreted hydrolase